MSFKKDESIIQDQQRTIWGQTINSDGTTMIWWTNKAVNHLNGKLSDDILRNMSDDKLLNLLDKEGEIERYRRPSDRKLCEQQGCDIPNSEYDGIHRAQILLMLRKKQYGIGLLMTVAMLDLKEKPIV